MKLKMLSATTLAATALLGLVACGSGEQNSAGEPATSSSSQAPATPAVPAEVVLGDWEAPAGYTFSDIGAFLENQAAAGENAAGTFDELYRVAEGTGTDPEQCGALLPTAVDTLLMLHEHPADAAAVDFVSADNATIITVLVTTTESGLAEPVAPEECAEFTRTSQVGDSSRTATYETQQREVSIDGAEDVTAAHIQTVATNLDNGETTTPEAEASEQMLAGTTDGVRFRIHASGPAEEQVLDELARAQVDKIRNR